MTISKKKIKFEDLLVDIHTSVPDDVKIYLKQKLDNKKHAAVSPPVGTPNGPSHASILYIDSESKKPNSRKWIQEHSCEFAVVLTDASIPITEFSGLHSKKCVCIVDTAASRWQEEVTKALSDAQYLHRLLWETNNTSAFLDVFIRSPQIAVKIVNRSFFPIYINETYRALFGSRADAWRSKCKELSRIQGIKENSYYCPSAELFTRGIVPPSQVAVKRTVDGTMAVTKSQVYPISDPTNVDRIIGSIQLETILDQDNTPTSKELLDAILKHIVQTTSFTRARVFRYNDKTKLLRGLKEESLDERGRIDIFLPATILPPGMYSDECLVKNKPIVRQFSSGIYEEIIFKDLFNKANAPTWVEYPLIIKGRWLGKLIVDRFTADILPPSDHKPSDEEIREVNPCAKLLSEIFAKFPSADEVIDTFDVQSTVSFLEKNIQRRLFESRESDDVLQKLVEFLVQELSEHVLSAFVRFPNPITKTLDRSSIGAGAHWNKFSREKIKIDDNRYVSSIAAKLRMQYAGPIGRDLRDVPREQGNDGKLSIDEQKYLDSYETLCALPLMKEDNLFALLVIQGKKSLLSPPLLDFIWHLASTTSEILHHISSLEKVLTYETLILRNLKHEATSPLIVFRDIYYPEIQRLLSNVKDDPSCDQILEDVGQALDVLLWTFEDYAFLGGAKLVRKDQDVDLMRIVRMVKNLLLWETHPIEIIREYYQPNSSRMHCTIDSHKVFTILHNLLRNAFVATEEKSDPAISLGIFLTNKLLTIIVEDNGRGIHPRDGTDIFHKGKSGWNSTGLGLYVVRQFALSMGGEEPRVFSNVDKGTRFVIELPLT